MSLTIDDRTQEPPPTDAQLVSRIRAGDPGSFELLMRRNNQRLFRMARAVMRNDSDAEDVVQQAYLSAYTHLEQWSGRAAVGTWLTTIVLREAYGRLKRAAAHPESPYDEQVMMMSHPAPDPEKRATARELSALLEQTVDGLPDIYRLVFVMRAVEGMSSEETALALEISEETVRVRLHRARGLIREALAESVEGAATSAFPFMGERCDRMVRQVLARLPPFVGK